jgi:hypothetical protein
MFTRTEDAPYFENGETIKRDTNQGTVGVGLSPGGGRITLSLALHQRPRLLRERLLVRLEHDPRRDDRWQLEVAAQDGALLQVGGALVRYLNPSAAPLTPALQRDNPLRCAR